MPDASLKGWREGVCIEMRHDCQKRSNNLREISIKSCSGNMTRRKGAPPPPSLLFVNM